MKRIVLVRHGNAEKGAHNQPDQTRELTGLGRLQAQNMKEQLLTHLGSDWKPDIIISSDRVRAQQTAAIIVGVQGVHHNASLHFMRELIHHPDPKTDKVIMDMFQNLKYKPLTDYFEKYGRGDDNGKPRQGQYFLDQADCAESMIMGLVEAVERLRSVDEVLIASHAVVTTALAWRMSNGNNACLEINMGEADAIVYDIATETIVHFQANVAGHEKAAA
jgi:broad specificity phosphatase PhoE